MKKLPAVLTSALLVGAVAVAQTQKNEKHSSRPSPSKVTDDQQLPAHQSQHQESPPVTEDTRTSLRETVKNSMPADVQKRVNEAMVPHGMALKQARELLNEGKFVEAEMECHRAMALRPQVKGHISYGTEISVLGDILLMQGRNEEALKYYLGVRTSSKPDNPDHPRPNLNAALAYCRMGNFKMAKKYCPDEVLAKLTSPGTRAEWPGTDSIQALEASLFFVRATDESSMCNYRLALRYLEAAEKLSPKNTLIAYAMGQTLYDLKRYKEATPYYKRVVQYGGDKVSSQVKYRASLK